MGGRGGGRRGRGRSQWGSPDASEDAAPRLLPSLRPERSRLPRLPGDEGRGGAQPGARRGRHREVRAAGAGNCGEGGAGARARAPRRGSAAAPPPAGCVAARARACVPAVRAGRDAEVKFGREGARSVSAREPEWPPLLSPARRRALGKGGGTGPPLVAGGREGGWVTRQWEL